ncbi:unnamed protein product [Eruca vesicaria subsp. sativa]|uniref:Uncharacterized protein n=1 Tax=Eruca vesicaria subsp. sativa TaxID=29727 RepID=A0ABC8KB78_ERUVS|nr:unnamed protein product [Eruca vesicaria subsp. sativa]
MHLAFGRDLIGPAVYFGLMGDGQPIGRYDDMWADGEREAQLLRPYFEKLADAMVTWIEAWDELNPPAVAAANGKA